MGVAGVVAFVVFRRGALFVVVVVAAAVVVVVRARFLGEGETSVGQLLVVAYSGPPLIVLSVPLSSVTTTRSASIRLSSVTRTISVLRNLLARVEVTRRFVSALLVVMALSSPRVDIPVVVLVVIRRVWTGILLLRRLLHNDLCEFVGGTPHC